MIIDGIKLKNILMQKYRKELKKINTNLKLVVILIGKDKSSLIYVKNKKKVCEELNIECEILHFYNIEENNLIKIIKELNNKKEITGIMIELPLPTNYNKTRILNSIDSKKDIEGLTNYNKDNLKIIPCTALAVLFVLDYYKIDIKRKKICIIGYSELVGKPLEKIFFRKNITPIICRSNTLDLKNITKNCDIIISAVGKPNLITKEMVKDGAVILDIGITKSKDKIVGDVDFDNLKSKCDFITPVPKGIGPITTAMVISNLIALYKINNEQ